MGAQSRLNPRKVEENIQEYTRKIVKVMKANGVLTTEEETFCILLDVLENFRSKIFKDCGLFFTISDAWDEFTEDYLAFQKGELSERNSTKTWMWYDNLPDNSLAAVIARSGAVYETDAAEENAVPASAEDKRMFFQIMEATRLPILDYYMPLRDDEFKYIPRIHRTHNYHNEECMVVEYKCVDDGGLMNDAEPVGKTFTLVSDIGLRALVTITEERELSDDSWSLDKVDNYAPIGKFLGRGFIEGYTVFGKDDVQDDEIPDIVVRTNEKNEIIKLGICIHSSAACDACSSFPLWQDYFNKTSEKLTDEKNMIWKAAEEIYEAAGSPKWERKK